MPSQAQASKKILQTAARVALLGLLIALGLFLPLTVGSQDRAVKVSSDPLTAARFAIVIDGYEIATFSELATTVPDPLVVRFFVLPVTLDMVSVAPAAEETVRFEPRVTGTEIV